MPLLLTSKEVKAGLSPSKKSLYYLLHLKPFKNDEKCFLFILEALFVFKIFKLSSWLFGHACSKNDLIKEIRLNSKFMTSHPG